ncbi:MAG: hypothetical protein HY705_10770 [Gemmatimonadetes bacterium]|nr:hypothetical protein [Gemmatimonadota bacterium]
MNRWRASELRATLRGRRGDDEDDEIGGLDDFEEDDEFEDEGLDDEEEDEEPGEDEEDDDFEDYDEEFDDDGVPRRGGRPRRAWEE